jgi:hypothetical protein
MKLENWKKDTPPLCVAWGRGTILGLRCRSRDATAWHTTTFPGRMPGRKRAFYCDKVEAEATNAMPMTGGSEPVAEALRRAFPAGPPRGEAGGWLNPALDVLDCVLSLNRNYDRFCLPRVTAFRDRHPEITSLRGLRGLIGSYPTPIAFSIAELNYRDERRAATLVGVTGYLIKAQAAFSGATEAERLLQWALSVQPSDYWTVGVPGFGLSGFQYLRRLLGAQTVKPDIHIRRFVSSAIGRKVGDVEALAALETAGKRIGWPLADLDYAIWDGLARGSMPASQPASSGPQSYGAMSTRQNRAIAPPMTGTGLLAGSCLLGMLLLLVLFAIAGVKL